MGEASILELQQALVARGFAPRDVPDWADGYWGPNTRKAYQRFEEAHGFPPDGKTDRASLSKLLGRDVGTLVLWGEEANRLYGIKEGPGAENNRVILDWADNLDVHYPSDDIAWCGLFVAHCIREALPGEPLPANPLGAREYMKFGQPVPPQKWAIGVFWRESRESWKGHVGFLIGRGRTPKGVKAYLVRGGNQADSVSDTWIAEERLLGARWPVTGIPPQNISLAAGTAGGLSTNEA